MRKSKYNWTEIQYLYDGGLTWAEVSEELHIPVNTLKSAHQRGFIKSRPASDNMKLVSKKISNSMKKAHSEGRHLGWLSVNLNKEKRTYPEQYFLDAINKNGLFLSYTILEKVPFNRYVFDFVIAEFKIDIEIDGDYHRTDIKTVAKDERRDKLAIANGWRVFRISWHELSKNANKVLEELSNFIKQYEQLDEKYIIFAMDVEKIDARNFRAAKVKIFTEEPKENSRRKGGYFARKNRKVERPTKDELSKLIWQKPTSHIAKSYGVSDVAVSKWCKWYGIEKPPRGYWSKF